MRLQTQLVTATLLVASIVLIDIAIMKTPREEEEHARFRMLGEVIIEDVGYDDEENDASLLVRTYIQRVLEASMYAGFYTVVLAVTMTTMWLCLRPLRVLISPFTSKPAAAKHTGAAVVAVAIATPESGQCKPAKAGEGLA